MEQRRLPLSRIPCPRISDPKAFTAETHQSSHRIAYAEPAYPPQARTLGIQGKVVLDAVIGKDGIVQSLSARSGDPLLAESALQTVRHWAYRPTTVNGIAVEVETQIEVRFTLPDAHAVA